MNHDWQTRQARPGYSRDVCTECGMRAIRWLDADGIWRTRILPPSVGERERPPTRQERCATMELG